MYLPLTKSLVKAPPLEGKKTKHSEEMILVQRMLNGTGYRRLHSVWYDCITDK